MYKIVKHTVGKLNGQQGSTNLDIFSGLDSFSLVGVESKTSEKVKPPCLFTLEPLGDSRLRATMVSSTSPKVVLRPGDSCRATKRATRDSRTGDTPTTVTDVHPYEASVGDHPFCTSSTFLCT